MENKKGTFFNEQVLKIVISIACLLILLGLAGKYFYGLNNNDYKRAENQMDKIEGTIDLVKGDGEGRGYLLTNPSNWFFVGFVGEKVPSSCNGDCLCICPGNSLEDCESGVCRDVNISDVIFSGGGYIIKETNSWFFVEISPMVEINFKNDSRGIILNVGSDSRPEVLLTEILDSPVDIVKKDKTDERVTVKEALFYLKKELETNEINTYSLESKYFMDTEKNVKDALRTFDENLNIIIYLEIPGINFSYGRTGGLVDTATIFEESILPHKYMKTIFNEDRESLVLDFQVIFKEDENG